MILLFWDNSSEWEVSRNYADAAVIPDLLAIKYSFVQ